MPWIFESKDVQVRANVESSVYSVNSVAHHSQSEHVFQLILQIFLQLLRVNVLDLQVIRSKWPVQRSLNAVNQLFTLCCDEGYDG